MNLTKDQSYSLSQEEKKFEAVEKEYESVAELAKEDEVEVMYVLLETICYGI